MLCVEQDVRTTLKASVPRVTASIEYSLGSVITEVVGANSVGPALSVVWTESADPVEPVERMGDLRSEGCPTTYHLHCTQQSLHISLLYCSYIEVRQINSLLFINRHF